MSRVGGALGCAALAGVAWFDATAQSEPSSEPESLARFESVVDLPGFQAAGGRPWSPRQPYLALTDDEALYVLDPTAANPAPRALLATDSPFISWSPDGRWLVCNLRYGDRDRNEWGLVAVNVEDGTLETLHVGPAAWPFVWADDGNIYLWDRDTQDPVPYFLPPPEPWKEANPESFAPRIRLLPRSNGHRLSTMRFSTYPEPVLESLPALRALGGGHILVHDEFPDGKHFLVRGPGDGADAFVCYVVDFRGNVVTELRDDVTWTGVSGDGRWLVGHRVPLVEERRAEASLFYGDVQDRWKAPIAGCGTGMNPRVSHAGDYMTFQGTNPYRVRIGRMNWGEATVLSGSPDS